MVFFHDNYLSLSENSRVTFIGNRATDTGGAMYIVTSPFHYTRHDFILDNRMCFESCFLKCFDRNNSVKQLILTNNSADQGGVQLQSFRSRVWRVPAWSQFSFRVCTVPEMFKQISCSTHSICLGKY